MLYVQAGGALSWVLRIQVNGKRRDVGLGSTDTVSLAEAREKATEIRKLYRSGVDPIAHKHMLKEKQKSVLTFKEAAQAVFEEQKTSWRNAKHRNQWISTLEKYAFPLLGNLPVDQIEAPQIR